MFIYLKKYQTDWEEKNPGGITEDGLGKAKGKAEDGIPGETGPGGEGLPCINIIMITG